MNFSALPEKFWHCVVTIRGGKSGETAVMKDLGRGRLLREIVEPWHAGRAFTVNRLAVKSRDMVSQIKIAHTEQPASFYHDQHYRETRQSGIADVATNTDFLAVGAGEDYTDLLLYGAAAREKEIKGLSGRIKTEVDELDREIKEKFGL
jgi:hypothetical protein